MNSSAKGNAQSAGNHLEHEFIPRFTKDMCWQKSFDKLKQFASQFSGNSCIYTL
jgi:hypothetical protein